MSEISEIRGIDILVSVKQGEAYVPVGGQRSASLSRTSETIDVSNKVSGDWKRSIAGLKEWSVDCDGLLLLDDAAYIALEEAFLDGDEVEIQIAGTEGSVSFVGPAIITDFPIDAPYDDVATYSLSFTGAGALAAS